jgi:indolepyruvate ferredoxin oxidoreductase beta subunit
MVDVYLVGVGGQGIITASRVIGDAAILEGKNVLLSETHGMAQRGGSVVCTARIGDANSPIIPDGQADVILSFEMLETLRALCKASNRTAVVSSTERIVPLSVSTQKLGYPAEDEIKSEVLKVAGSYSLIDAPRISRSAGVPMSSNVVMTGALAGTGTTGIRREFFERALQMNVPRRIPENLAAFSLGFDAVAHK